MHDFNLIPKDVIWLASFPRSGNTLLRTILNHCFNIKSASIYTNDLGGNQQLESIVGHIASNDLGEMEFDSDAPKLVKTHRLPTDAAPAIYVARDGREACVSFWRFHQQGEPLCKFIDGQRPAYDWSAHIRAWQPWDRPNTLFLRYEELIGDLPLVLEKISRFLGCRVVTEAIPARQDIIAVDGRWVTPGNRWQDVMTEDALALFFVAHGEMMARLGYS